MSKFRTRKLEESGGHRHGFKRWRCAFEESRHRLGRRLVADRRVGSSAVVVRLDELDHRMLGGVPGREAPPVVHLEALSVAKNDSATALSWQLPVRLQDRRTSLSRAHSARSLLVYCAPRSVLSRYRLSSDHGSEFDNAKIDCLLDAFDVRRSLSKKGCPYDNAVDELANKMLKAEFAHRESFANTRELQVKLSDYVHRYNNFRIHLTLGYMSPVEFKKAGLAL